MSAPISRSLTAQTNRMSKLGRQGKTAHYWITDKHGITQEPSVAVKQEMHVSVTAVLYVHALCTLSDRSEI